jgi:hypothetical protein
VNWEEAMIQHMTDKGWKCDVNDASRLGFSLYQDEKHEWIRDYDKKTHHYIQMNGRQIVNLKTISGKDLAK